MKPSSKPTNPHSRFIPREEIDGVAAWHFSAMDGSDDAATAAVGDTASEGVTSEVLQEARQQAYAEGFARGRDAGGQEVRDALEATVRMHPGDLALMKGALLETLASPTPEFVADATVSPGGCLVESATMAVDATIEKRWSRAVGNLGLDAAWNPGNADV
jgi:flagellar biosynthesis/type III secretory pathway protein FliH